jgi:hypothetical protein
LAFAQIRQQDDFSVGELKGVMMNVGLALVDLLEFRHRVPEPPREDDASLALNLFLKGELRAGKQTYGQFRLVDRCKPTRNCVGESRCYELIADPRRSRRD